MPHYFLSRPETRQNYLDAVMRPASGEMVLLALRHVPKTQDIIDMVSHIDSVELYGSIDREYRCSRSVR